MVCACWVNSVLIRDHLPELEKKTQIEIIIISQLWCQALHMKSGGCQYSIHVICGCCSLCLLSGVIHLVSKLAKNCNPKNIILSEREKKNNMS